MTFAYGGGVGWFGGDGCLGARLRYVNCLRVVVQRQRGFGHGFGLGWEKFSCQRMSDALRFCAGGLWLRGWCRVVG